MASLILGKCHERSQRDKGEIKVQRTQEKEVGGGGQSALLELQEKKQGPEHKASQIDLSLHQEGRAKALHYHNSPYPLR